MIEVRAIHAAAAAGALAGLAELDPRGLMTPADLPALCEQGQCFELVAPGARAVYVVQVANGVAWVSALAGQGAGLDVCQAVDAVLTAQARGLRSVALQTARPGLVRKLSRLGYRVTGWVMQKDVACSSVN